MMLDVWMKTNGYTDEAFGQLIERGRLAVLRYRHGKQMPRPAVAKKIETVTSGEVTAADLYRGCMLDQAAMAPEVAA